MHPLFVQKLPVALAFILLPALAQANCPDFSGSYEGTVGSSRRVRLEVTQTGCERIEANYIYTRTETQKRTILPDGQRRQDMDSTDILIFSTYSWAGQEVSLLQETRWRADNRRMTTRGRISKGAQGEWIERTRYFDDAGNDLGETNLTFRRR